MSGLVRKVELLVVVQLLEAGQAGEVNHRRRSAQHGDRLRRRREQIVFDHLVVDEADAELPLLRRPVDGVPNLELLLVLRGEHVEVVAQQNVLL